MIGRKTPTMSAITKKKYTNMANNNTKRNRKDSGYGVKRGFPIISEFGATHGSKKRKGPRVFRVKKES